MMAMGLVAPLIVPPLTLIGIIGTALLPLSVPAFMRRLTIASIVYAANYLSFGIYVSDAHIAFMITFFMLIALILASVILRLTFNVLDVYKKNRLIRWGGKAVLWGALTAPIYVGLPIMILGFLFVSIGALRR